MTVTTTDIEREHREALAALTPQQRRAIDRLRVAKQATHFSGRSVDESLQVMFAAEAAARTEAEDHALMEAARLQAEAAAVEAVVAGAVVAGAVAAEAGAHAEPRMPLAA